jgi:hypothetical protein
VKYIIKHNRALGPSVIFGPFDNLTDAAEFCEKFSVFPFILPMWEPDEAVNDRGDRIKQEVWQ